MQKTTVHTVSIVMMVVALCCCIILQSCAQDNLKNAAALSLPITNKKMVIAHCMTNIIRYKGHKFEDSCDPDYYSPKGNVSAPIGGLTQVVPMNDRLLKDASLDEAVEFEMRTAIKSGIDGFQFYYTLYNDSWDDIIKAYFRVADAKNIDFKLALCISHPSGSTEDKKIQEFAKRINGILDAVGRNNSHWLRTPDGRLVVYLWYGEQIADIPANLKGKPEQYYMANAFKKLGDAVNEKFACIYCINENITKQKLNRVLDYFPAVWIWTLPYKEQGYIGNLVADECKKRDRTFEGSTFNDFYTSKLLKRGTWDMFHDVQDAVNAGMENVERKYVATGLSYNFRSLFEFGIKREASVINIITWNDYPEGHHIAPEINHNDGFAILLNYYKGVWKQQPFYKDEDVIVSFFKKYKHDVTPKPFDIPVVSFEENGVSLASEDAIEVVTILKDKASLNVNGKILDVPAGFAVTRFPQNAGAVTAAIIRNGLEVKKFTTPEWITDKPYRSDRITYSYSSEFGKYYKSIFGDLPPIYSMEYNADSTRLNTGRN
ncbi:endo-1,3-alpha-glucanase family glycosylhydrolase [Chitinophagaceae bacterium 26-R-25]|nr:endo-1,3-alpha-glucanase family glycosylhydrolase [Chitinophagaceae bacterium 26-R-25]